MVPHLLLLLALFSALLAGVGKQVMTIKYKTSIQPLTHQISDTVGEPYMDEIFHIPQAQAYCASQLSLTAPNLLFLFLGLHLLLLHSMLKSF